ncbi:xanthine dehydrogenase/oxidase-like [Glandiceps talaboti]
MGSAVTMATAIGTFDKLMTTLPEASTQVLKSLKEMLMYIGGPQTRNTATIGGHIVAALLTSDVLPSLIAAECYITIIGPRGVERTIPLEKFRVHERAVDLEQREILGFISIPLTKVDEYFKSYRIYTPHRRDIELDVISAGMRVRFIPGEDIIHDMNITFGGIGQTGSNKIRDSGRTLKGRQWDESILQDVFNILQHVSSDVRISKTAAKNSFNMEQARDFKLAAMRSYFFKFYHYVKQERFNNNSLPSMKMTLNDCPPMNGSQKWQECCKGSVGKPIRHMSSSQQATGEALYLDDLPPRHDELFLALVTSSRPHAKIRSVDPSQAMLIDGVKCYIDKDDVPGCNMLFEGPDFCNYCLADDEVTCVGAIIGGILATDRQTARRAAKLVRVEYDDLDSILSIEEAIEKESFYKPIKQLVHGNIEESFGSCDEVLEGEMRVGGQEQYYLEPHSCLVIPDSGDQKVEVIVATQCLADAQTAVANVLGIQCHKVICKTARIGGGFGGKGPACSQHAAICAVAVNKAKCPVRLILERDEDMKSTGGRAPVLFKYKIGFTTQGRVAVLDVAAFMDAGDSPYVCNAILNYIIENICNVYDIPNVRVKGYICKTNKPSNTAMRGFGRPQSVVMIESLISDVAYRCGLSQTRVRELNFHREGFVTHCRQTIKQCNTQRCWEECLQQSNFYQRQEMVISFNRQHEWLKRGISINPLMLGVGFGTKMHMQGNALIQIFLDGSVLLTHGGVEMGQGLHTKMIQIASNELNVPVERIYISETNTSSVPNASGTAADTGTDLNGGAVKEACEQIMRRMQPIVDDHPAGSWNEWVQAAYKDRINLSAVGHFIVEDIKEFSEIELNCPPSYFVFGSACSEVEIDCLTGEHRVLRTDIVLDVGRSINPAVDIGQVEGAFVQGYGMYMTEEWLWSDQGELIHSGPGMYRLPRVYDIPREFNVQFLKDSENTCNIYSSKGTGQATICLGNTVYFATKEAIRAARSDIGLEQIFDLDTPAIPRRVLLACGDQYTKK